MSMEFLTLIQLLYVSLLYIIVYILVPAAVFHRKFEGRPLYVRVMAYLTIGNFYVMNLVYLLQLLHISNRATLILGYLIPVLLAIAVFNWQEWVKASLVNAGETTHNVMVNTMGIRLLFIRLFQNFWQTISNLAKSIGESIILRWMDWIGTIAIILLVCWQYGTNLFCYFGYTASDMLVHNYWVNSMNTNDIFVGGVYPFGFHCIIYYIHSVFGIETYVILRVFSLIETTLIHVMLLCFLRLVCKLETMAYVVTAVYLVINMWGENTYMRYFSALPQEYGMIFILPAVCFLLLFLRERWGEEGEKGLRADSTQVLLLFAMNVALTLAAHFYDTIALGIFCISVAIGFAYRVFRKPLLFRIVGFGLGGLLVAVLPMWIAYVSGTPMEGSLRWGMSVIKGMPETNTPEATKTILQDYNIVNYSNGSSTTQGNATNNGSNAGVNTGSAGTDTANGNSAQTTVVKPHGKLQTFFYYIKAYLAGYVFEGGREVNSILFLMALILGSVFSALCFIHGDAEHGSILATVVVNSIFFCIILISREIGIPVLMDKNRTSVYLAYYFVLLLGLVLDYVASLLLGFAESEIFLRITPGAVGFGFLLFLCLLGVARKPALVEAFQKNGAVICVTNILRDNPPNSFTIVSANDETRMIEDYGYHFEANKLLINNLGSNADSFLIIPASKLYVFIEKIPGDYDEPYEGSGQAVSRESASQPLPVGYGINMYKGRQRHIVMSKLFYWAQEFRHMFENEFTVYYEDAEFVCYLISQNVDRPYDMSFDYGYNN